MAAVMWTYRTVHESDEAGQRVQRTQETLWALDDTLRRAVDVETAERGFQLTRDARDATAFDRARAQVGPSIDHLAAMLRDEGRGADAEALRGQIGVALAGFDRVVDRIRAGERLDAPPRAVGRVNLDAVRSQTREIRRMERESLHVQMHNVNRTGRWSEGVAIVMTGVATLLLTTLMAVLVFLARPGLWRTDPHTIR